MQGSFAFASCTALSSLLKPTLRLYAHSHHNTSRSCSPAYDMHCQSPRSSRGVKLVAFCSRIRWEETMLRSKSRRQAAVSSVRYTGCPCCYRRRLAGSSIDFDDSVGVLNVVAVTELRSMVTASQAPQGSEPDCCGAAFLVDVEEFRFVPCLLDMLGMFKKRCRLQLVVILQCMAVPFSRREVM
jgi:hypothetical protein